MSAGEWKYGINCFGAIKEYDSLEYAKTIADRLLHPEQEAKHTYGKIVWEANPDE